jgi:hypothetical protein
VILLACGVFCAAGHADDKSTLSKLLADLQPGKIVEVPDGTFTLSGHLKIAKAIGTQDQPVIIRAAHRGKAVIAGTAGLVLSDCEHLVLEGFVFENDADQQCVRMDNCRNVRVTRNIFRPKERAKPRHWEHWVEVNGARSDHNRIDHNLFEKKINRGSPLFIRGDDDALVCSQHDRIDHNHFRDVRYADGENGHETIRTGGNDLGASGRSSFTVIEDNLLERCSGEDECMSLKSSDNIVRRNTLINCRGAICMRLGNRSVADGNVIIATEDGPAFGGIKLFGFEHRVTGNYFAGLTGRRHEAPFSLFPGMHDTPTTGNIRDNYDDNTASAATRCLISNNTWVDCAPLQLGLEKPDGSWVHLPAANTFTGNRIIHTRPMQRPPVIAGLMNGFLATDNHVFGSAEKPDAAWTSWFIWESSRTPHSPPKPLRPDEVGPDAP